ncbi:MAG: thiamine pyrophosphate-dependent enzyme [Dehalococcoidia bacterium]|nr:thiamine pyrophosphate-dependent enzyme [Dehalococcoidia bacterium]
MNREVNAVNKEIVSAPPKMRLIIPGGLGPNICPGCGHFLVTKIICEVIEEMGIGDRTMHALGAGCASIASLYIKNDWAGCSHGSAPAVATGIKRVHPNAVVYTVQGDGDAVAIGAGALINAAARGEKITVLMLNNTQYGTTGGQMGPTTLDGQVTTTSPLGRNPSIEGHPLRAAEMIATIRSAAYSARGAVNSPKNFQLTKKYLKTAFQSQIDNKGFSFLEIITQCPTNWHMKPPQSAKYVEEKVIPEFPLGEFKNTSSSN